VARFASRRHDESRIEQKGGRGKDRRKRPDAEAGKSGPDRGNADTGEDESVPERASAKADEGNGDDRERAEGIRDDGQEPCWPEGEGVLRLGQLVSGDPVDGHRQRDAERKSHVDECDDARPATADEEERAGAEERGR
jgi:hypothetical protein